MNETSKTLSFVAAAVALMLLGWLVSPRSSELPEADLAGQILFPSLDNPANAKAIEIVSYDPKKRPPLRSVKVDQSQGEWVLASNNNYPADAEQRVADAASALVGMKALQVVSNDPARHAELGVVEPNKDTVSDDKGVGKKVEIFDKSGNSLARLVLGLEDTAGKESASSRKNLRYVRVLPHDAVYLVEMPNDHFSPLFEDWIKTDVLDLSLSDLAEVGLKDYTVDAELTLTGARVNGFTEKSNIWLNYDSGGNWAVRDMIEFVDGEPKPVKLADDEELNLSRLAELRSSLKDLKIVDVHRKPAGLSGSLRADKQLLSDQEAFRSLVLRGFYPVEIEKDKVEILSNDGEVVVRRRDGVEYTLRFGNIAGIGDTGVEEGKSTPDKTPGAAQGSKLDRFIMVSARFNESLVQKPVLQPLPEKKPPSAATNDAAKSDDATKTDPAKTDPAKTDPAKTDPAKTDTAKTDTAKTDTAKTDTAKTDTAKTDTASKEQPELSDEELELERKRVQEANKAAEDQYQRQLTQGKQAADRLNARFSDWYYVVSEDVYGKIHLTRNDIVRKKPLDAKPAGDAALPATPQDLKSFDPFRKSAPQQGE